VHRGRDDGHRASPRQAHDVLGHEDLLQQPGGEHPDGAPLPEDGVLLGAQDEGGRDAEPRAQGLGELRVEQGRGQHPDLDEARLLGVRQQPGHLEAADPELLGDLGLRQVLDVEPLRRRGGQGQAADRRGPAGGRTAHGFLPGRPAGAVAPTARAAGGGVLLTAGPPPVGRPTLAQLTSSVAQVTICTAENSPLR
jgi:hypothetical protein